MSIIELLGTFGIVIATITITYVLCSKGSGFRGNHNFVYVYCQNSEDDMEGLLVKETAKTFTVEYWPLAKTTYPKSKCEYVRQN